MAVIYVNVIRESREVAHVVEVHVQSIALVEGVNLFETKDGELSPKKPRFTRKQWKPFVGSIMWLNSGDTIWVTQSPKEVDDKRKAAEAAERKLLAASLAEAIVERHPQWNGTDQI